MARRKGVLSGSALSDQSKIARDLPTVGPKDFIPTNSWLEKRQIEKSLENHFELIREQRIEKTSNISSAEWCSERNKAKLNRKVGKHFEVLGHHDDNEDWLYPEEALYLLETKSLELFYGGIRLSIERAYSLLLESWGEKYALQQYITYSHLSRLGYKVLRHLPDTRPIENAEDTKEMKDVMKKQNSDTDTVDDPTTHSVPKEDWEIETGKIEFQTKSEVDQESLPVLGTSTCKDQGNAEKEEKHSISPRVATSSNRVSPTKGHQGELHDSQDDVIFLPPSVEDVIVIDDEEEVVVVEPNDCTADDDIVCITPTTGQETSRKWYFPVKLSLLPTENCSLNISRKVRKKKKSFALVQRDTILKTIPNAISGASPLRRPHTTLLPSSVCPVHEIYDVSLNIEHNATPRSTPNPVSYAPNVTTPDSLQRQVNDLHNMFQGMLQATSSMINMLIPNPYTGFNRHPVPANIPSFFNRPQNSNTNRMHMLSHFSVGMNLPFPYNPMPRPSRGQYFNQQPWFNYHAPGNRSFYRNFRGGFHRGYRSRRRFGNMSERSEVVPKPTVVMVELDDDDDDDDVIIIGAKKHSLPLPIDVPIKRIKKDEDEEVKADILSDHDLSCRTSESVDRVVETDENVAKAEVIGSDNEVEVMDVESKSGTTEDGSKEKSVGQSECWQNFKTSDTQEEIDQSEDLDIEPLVNPIDHTSFESVLKALQIFDSHTETTSRNIKVSFDVHTSSCTFKKTAKGLPHLRVIVLDHSEDLPSSCELQSLSKIYSDGVPFLFSAVSDDDITFYNYDVVSLPSLS